MDVLEARVAADHIVDDRRAIVGDAQAHRPLRLGLTAEAAVGPMQLLVSLDVISGRVGAVGMPARQERCERLLMALGALGLEDRPLIPIELQPAQRVEDLLDVLGRGALAVGVLDAKHQRAPLAARQQPVEQGGAGAPDVERPGGRGSEPHAHGGRDAVGLSGSGGNHKIAAMLIGAHVSPAGGLPKAIERGEERGCRAIQIFNQSPRMWRADRLPR